MVRDPKRCVRQRKTVRSFDDDESDETIISLGFVDPKTTPEALAGSQCPSGN
jgi:hypothetical protein